MDGGGAVGRMGLRGAEETAAVWDHFDGARSDDLLALFGEFLEDREHQILLAQRRCALDAKLFGHFDELRGGYCLAVFKMHGWSPDMEIRGKTVCALHRAVPIRPGDDSCERPGAGMPPRPRGE